MAYPPRPQRKAMPQFTGTNQSGARVDPELVAFVVARYNAGQSLREIAELTDRTHSAVRNILQRAAVHRRGPGAPPASAASDTSGAKARG